MVLIARTFEQPVEENRHNNLPAFSVQIGNVGRTASVISLEALIDPQILVRILTFSALGMSLLLFAAIRRPQPAHAHAEPATGHGMTVVTLNMAKETNVDKILRELRAIPVLRDADVLLLQEVKQDENQRQCAAEHLAAALGYHVVYSPAATGVTDLGLAILSRFPLRDKDVRALKRCNLRFRSRSRIALAATAESPWGPVRILNTHLDTRVNTRERLEQLEPVVRVSEEFSGPRIIAGDFNSNRFYWVGNVFPLPALRSQAYGVQDFMVQRGFRTAAPAGEASPSPA